MIVSFQKKIKLQSSSLSLSISCVPQIWKNKTQKYQSELINSLKNIASQNYYRLAYQNLEKDPREISKLIYSKISQIPQTK